MSKTTAPSGLFALQGVHPAMASFIVLVVAAIGWLPHLTNSLLLDETLTAWVVRDGLAEALERTLHFQPQPAYNVLMWGWTQFAGLSEMALRMPSLLAALVACVAIAQLGTRLTGDRETGLLAAVVLATSWNFYRESVDARSYLLGLVVLLWLALCLIRWIEQGRNREAFFCGVLAALLPHFHFFFVLCYPALLVYGWLRRSEARWNAKQFVIVGSILLIGALLYIPIGSMLAAQGGSYSFVPAPQWRSLFEVFVWTAPIAGLLVGIAATALFGSDSLDAADDAAASADSASLSRASLALLALWMIAPLLILFTVSITTEMSIFLGRYLIPAIPAVSLFYAIVLRRIPSGPARVIAIVVVAFASLAIHDRPHDDFRGAARAVNEFVAGEAATPVLLASGLIEGEDVNWLRDPKLAEYLNTPTKYYPMDGRLVTLPRRLKDHPMTSEIVAPVLANGKRFVVVEWFANGARATRWLLARAVRAGYSAEKRSFGGVRVVFFRPRAGGAPG
ncbi:MAG: glycosyltransferase family 39 protein [Myxococcota bacterium]